MAYNINSTVTGLTTYIFGVPATGEVLITGTLALPTIPEGEPGTSQVVVTITQTPSGGGPTTIFTGQPGAKGFTVKPYCNALDIITISLSSAAAVDQTPNRIKMTVSIG